MFDTVLHHDAKSDFVPFDELIVTLQYETFSQSTRANPHTRVLHCFFLLLMHLHSLLVVIPQPCTSHSLLEENFLLIGADSMAVLAQNLFCLHHLLSEPVLCFVDSSLFGLFVFFMLHSVHFSCSAAFESLSHPTHKSAMHWGKVQHLPGTYTVWIQRYKLKRSCVLYLHTFLWLYLS